MLVTFFPSTFTLYVLSFPIVPMGQYLSLPTLHVGTTNGEENLETIKKSNNEIESRTGWKFVTKIIYQNFTTNILTFIQPS